MTLPLKNVSLAEWFNSDARCTLEFKQEAVRLVDNGKSIAMQAARLPSRADDPKQWLLKLVRDPRQDLMHRVEAPFP